jgi:SAM-dependent methyltransferase
VAVAWLRRRRRPALDDEVAFWSDYLATRGGAWRGAYARRLDPAAPVEDPLLYDCIGAVPRREVTILDVGAGPLTSVGAAYPGKRIEVVAVDPLAERYDELLRRFEVEPPVRTRPGTGERLPDLFPANSFDIAYARNSLDHGDDPAAAVLNMLAVVRPGGFVILRHYENEGEQAGYSGLHSWNFTERDGRLLIRGRDGAPQDVSALLTRYARVAVTRTEVPGVEGRDWICAVIEKRDQTVTGESP